MWSYCKITANVPALGVSGGFRSTKLSASTEFDMKQKASFKH